MTLSEFTISDYNSGRTFFHRVAVRARSDKPPLTPFVATPLDESNEPSHSLHSWETPRDEANTVVHSDDRQYRAKVQKYDIRVLK
jgi:hypothetical protein